MVQCEMCGTETASPNRVKIEGAELDVCDECTDFGTEVTTQDTSSTSTKYSTSSSSGGSSSGSTSSSSGGSSSSSSSGGSRRGQDMFDDIEAVAQDFDERIRSAREDQGLSQEDLAKAVNEKASLVRKLEHGDTLPSDEVQRELEGELDIDLSAGGGEEETDWSGSSSAGETTLGDVVQRKD